MAQAEGAQGAATTEAAQARAAATAAQNAARHMDAQRAQVGVASFPMCTLPIFMLVDKHMEISVKNYMIFFG